MNIALQKHRNDDYVNYVIFIDLFYQYVVTFSQEEAESAHFYLLLLDRNRIVERIKCRVTFLTRHLERFYYRFEPLVAERKYNRFCALLQTKVNRSTLNGSLLLTHAPLSYSSLQQIT